MIKRRKRVTLTEQMIDDIWLYWRRISETNVSKTAAINKVADMVGCSHATVYRVVSACEEASSGKVIAHDRLKYPNMMMVKYINTKFSQGEVDATTAKSDTKSDIAALAEALHHLASAIEKFNK